MKKKNENNQSQGHLIFGVVVLTVILVAWFFAGCISIKKHERLKIESERALVLRFFNSVDKYRSIEDMKYDLKGILDAYELRLHRTGDPK